MKPLHWFWMIMDDLLMVLDLHGLFTQNCSNRPTTHCIEFNQLRPTIKPWKLEEKTLPHNAPRNQQNCKGWNLCNTKNHPFQLKVSKVLGNGNLLKGSLRSLTGWSFSAGSTTTCVEIYEMIEWCIVVFTEGIIVCRKKGYVSHNFCCQVLP